jgi:hypothetical protein
MNRQAYRAARRLVRDNGRAALRWLPEVERQEMDALLSVQAATDRFAERAAIIAYCQSEGLRCNIRHTR